MRRSGDGIFGDSRLRSEKTGYEIRLFAFCRNDDPPGFQFCDGFQSRFDVGDIGFVRENQHVIGSSFIGPDRFFIEAVQEFVRNRNFVRFVGRKVQRQAVRFFAHLQFPAPGRVETDRGFSPIFVFEQDVGRRQRGVTAQVYLGVRRKPSDFVPVAPADVKGRFGEVVFHRDFLQEVVAYPTVQRADGRRVARE